jgi:high mobility group protein B3
MDNQTIKQIIKREVDKLRKANEEALMRFQESLLEKLSEGPVETNKTKKPRKARDKNAPKPPLTTYIMYSNDRRQEVREANPEMKATEVTKEISKMWREVNDEEKKHYQSIYNENKKKFDEERELYHKVPEEEVEEE